LSGLVKLIVTPALLIPHLKDPTGISQFESRPSGMNIHPKELFKVNVDLKTLKLPDACMNLLFTKTKA
jgi:hypothetical protein